MTKLKNIYRTGIQPAMITTSTLAPKVACFRKVTEESIQAKAGGIILTGGQAESTMGIPVFELLICGSEFAAQWACTPGEHFLLSHLAGDPLGQYVFAEADDILMKWGSAIYEE